MIQNILRLIILFLRHHAENSRYAALIFRLTLLISSLERRERVQGYIFGKVALRQLLKRGHLNPPPPSAKPPRRRFLRRKAAATDRTPFAPRLDRRTTPWLGGVAQTRFAFITRLAIGLIRKLPMDETDRTEWLDGIEAASRTAMEAAQDGTSDILALSSLSGRRRTEFSEGLPSLLSKVQETGRLSICLEPGAPVPWSILDTIDPDCALTLYVMGEVPAFGTIRSRFLHARQVSMRDRFNDISPEGKALFEACDTSATALRKSILGKIGSVVGDTRGSSLSMPATLDEPLEAALSDKLSHQLSLYSCVRQTLLDAVKPVYGDTPTPQTTPLLISAARSGFMRAAPLHLTRPLPKSMTWLSIPPKDKDFALDLIQGLARTKSSESRDHLDMSEAKRAASTDLATALLRTRERSEDVIRTYMTSFEEFISGTPFVLFITAVAAPAYVKSFRELARSAITRFNADDFPVPVQIDFTRQMPLLASLRPSPLDDGGLSLSVETILRVGQSSNISVETAGQLRRWAADPGKPPLDLLRSEFLSLVATSMNSWLMQQVPQSLVLHDLGEEMAKANGICAALTSTSRNWLARSLSAGLRRGDDSLPVIDIQTLNMLAHPKYRPPVATHISVVSPGQAKLAHAWFGMNRHQVHINGALQDDALFAGVAEIDKATVRRDLRISDDARVITLISQLQPMEGRMLPLASALADRLDKDPTAHLVVRLHPRETQGRVDQYKMHFQDRGLGERVSFSRTESVEAVLAVTDTCTTIYSNMAREAVTVGCPVVLAGFLGWEPPLRLDREGFGSWAQTSDQFHTQIADALNKRASVTGDANRPDRKTAASRLLDTVIEVAGVRLQDISYRTFKPHPLMEPYETATLVAARGVPLALLPPLFGRHHKLTTYHPGINLPVGFLPPTTQFKSGRIDLEDEGAFEAAARDGNALAETLSDALIETFAEQPLLSRRLSDMRYALWLRLRPTLIDRYGHFNLMMRGIESAHGGALVLASRDPEELERLVLEALSRLTVDPEDIFVLDPDDEFNILSLSKYQVNKETAISTEVPQDLAWRKPLKMLEVFMQNLQAASPGIAEDADVIVTTDWKLKTVPPTIQPLIEQLSSDGRNIAVMSLTADHPGLADIRPLDGVTLIEPDDLYPEVYYLSGRNRKRLSDYIRICMQPILADCPPNVAAEAEQVLDAIMKTHLRTIIALQAYSRHIFDKPGHRVSLACPGRQWHADLVHGEAEASKRGFSMTLQNAYMTAGYTYTEPRGQYLSAMDAWSSDVFTEGYNVDPAKIHITSTPRFDYLATLKDRDPLEAKSKLGFDSARPVVIYASQPGPEVENQAVAEIFAELSADRTINAQFAIKTHPKQPLDRVREFLLWANAANPEHTVRVQRAGDIADFLTASDLALTVFSNVGVEAAISDTPVLVVTFSDRPLPLPLDEFGFSDTARDKDQLRELIIRSLSDTAFHAEQSALRQAYRAKNPAMADGSSAARLMRAIDGHLNKSWPTRRNSGFVNLPKRGAKSKSSAIDSE